MASLMFARCNAVHAIFHHGHNRVRFIELFSGSAGFSGFYSVCKGELHLTDGGTASAAGVTVWNTGTILGYGLVETTNGVTNQGTLSPDQTISITGNLAFSSIAT